jgi:hypothetical protein
VVAVRLPLQRHRYVPTAVPTASSAHGHPVCQALVDLEVDLGPGTVPRFTRFLGATSAQASKTDIWCMCPTPHMGLAVLFVLS